jgi:hypothetical protein
MKFGSARKPQQQQMPREADPASSPERSAAQSHKDRIAEYNRVLAEEGQNAADIYAHEATYASRTEYRKARG